MLANSEVTPARNSRKSYKKPILKLNGETARIHPNETLSTPSPPKRQTLRKKNNIDNFTGKSAYPYENLSKLYEDIQSAKKNNFQSVNMEMFYYNNVKPFLTFYEQSAWRCVYEEDFEFLDESKITAILASADGSTVVTLSENSFKGRKLEQRGHAAQLGSWPNQIITVGNISKDGKKVMLGAQSGSIALWLFLDQFELFADFRDHEEKVVSVCFSKTGERVASCGADKNIFIRNPSSREAFIASFRNTSTLISLLFHPNELHLLTADETNTVKIWHVYTGDIVSQFYHEGTLKSIAIDDTGTMLLSCMEKKIRIWTLENLLLEQTDNNYYDLVGHSKIVNKAVITPDQKKILSISNDSTLRVWDTENCDEDFELTTDNEFTDAYITNHSIIFAINNKLCIKTKNANAKFKRKQFPDLKKISSISFDSTGEKFAISCEERDIWILYLNEKMKEFDFILSRHTDVVTCVRFNEYNDNCLASGSKDKQIIIWDLKIRSCKKILQNIDEPVYRVLFSKGGRHLLTSGRKSRIKVWSLEQISEDSERFPLRTLEIEDQRNFIFTYDSKREIFATGGSEKTLTFWQYDEMKSDFSILDEKEFDQEITYLDCNPESSSYTYAVSFLNEYVRIYSCNFQQTKEILCKRCQICKSLLHPIANKLFVTTFQDTIQVWCLDSGMQVNIMDNQFPTSEHGICLSSKGSLLAIAGKAEKLKVIDLHNEASYLGIYKSYNIIKKNSLQILTEEILEKSNFEKMALYDEVFPVDMNLLSWILYKNDIETLEKFYELCKYFDVYPPQKPDWRGEFPLQTVVKFQNRKMISIILSLYFRKVPHIGCAPYISPDLLTGLIKMNIDSVSELIASRLILIKTKGNPWMTGERNYFSSSLCQEFDCNKTIPGEERNYQKLLLFIYRILRIKEKTPVQTPAMCYILDIKGILSPSNNFLWNVTRLNSLHRVFKNEAFLALLGLKWNQYAKSNFLKETVFFIIFLLLCTLNSVFILPERISEINQDHIESYSRTAVGMDLIIFLYIPLLAKRELYQIKKMGFKIYLNSFWNYLDLLTIMLGSLTIGLDLFQTLNSTVSDKDIIRPLKILHSFLLIITWMRVMNVARGFEGSSFMIHVFSAIFSNYAIKWFIFWIFWLLVGLSFVVYILNIGAEDNSRFSIFRSIYFVLLGDFGDFKTIYSSTEYFPNLLWFILLLSTIIMTIIMMNLLIAIISEIYTKVKEVEDAAFIFEKTMIISEVDKQYTDDFNHYACFNVDDYLILAKTGQKMDIPSGSAAQPTGSQLKSHIQEPQMDNGEGDVALKMRNLESKMVNLEKIQSNLYGTGMENYKTKYMEKREMRRRNTVRNFLEKMALLAADANQEETSPRLRVFRHLDKDRDGLIASIDLERALAEANSEFRPEELHKIMNNFRGQGKLKYTKDEFYDWCRSSLDNQTYTNFNSSSLFKK